MGIKLDYDKAAQILTATFKEVERKIPGNAPQEILESLEILLNPKLKLSEKV